MSSSAPSPIFSAAKRFARRVGEVVVDDARHVEAVRRGAGLAAVAHLGDHRAVERSVEVGVVADEEGGVAAELHRGGEHLVGCLLQEDPPDLGRAGEGEGPDPRVVQHARTTVRPVFEVT